MLNSEAKQRDLSSIYDLSSILQIVGHTARVNSIRTSQDTSSICIDAGMYLGGLAFLEITPDQKIFSYFLNGDYSINKKYDITEQICQNNLTSEL